MPPLPQLIFPQCQVRKVQQASLPIAAPDPDDFVLLAAHLRAKKGEKEDFDAFPIDDAAEISTNKTFLDHNLQSDEVSDEIDTDDED